MLRRMNTRARLASALLAVALLFAAAEARATPHNGSRELRIGQEFEPPINLTNGFLRVEPEQGSGATSLGLGAGMGWFVSDTIELGASLSFQLVKDNDTTLTGPGVSPFLRFMTVQGRVGYFAELDASFQRFSASSDAGGGGGSITMISLGADVGLEFFVTDDWAVRVAPTFRHVILSASSDTGNTSADTSQNRFGLVWGLACYF